MESENGIVFEYMIPNNLAQVMAIPQFHDSYRNVFNLLTQYNLPIVTEDPWPNENEISIRRALLPNFITKVMFFSENTTQVGDVISPGFTSEDFRLSEVELAGLKVNQSNFSQKIQQSNYKRAGRFFTNEFEEIEDI